MGLRKWVKRVGHEVREQTKNTGRQVLEVHGKVGKVAIPTLATGASFFFGPAAGLGVTALARPIQRYAIAAGARGDGLSGREARTYARERVNRTTKYALMGTALGTLGSVAAGGSGFTGYSSTFSVTQAAEAAGAAAGASSAGLSGAVFANQLYGANAGKIEENPKADPRPVPEGIVDRIINLGEGYLENQGGDQPGGGTGNNSGGGATGFIGAPATGDDQGSLLVPALLLGGLLLLAAA